MAERSFFSWLKRTNKSRTTTRRRFSVRLSLESLEDRLAPAAHAVIFSVPDTAHPQNWSIVTDGVNGRTFYGTPFVTGLANGIATFYMEGDVSVPDNTTITAVTPNSAVPIALIVDGNLTLGQKDFINFAADGASPGPGGGMPGDGGAGGAGGAGQH